MTGLDILGLTLTAYPFFLGTVAPVTSDFYYFELCITGFVRSSPG